MSRTFRKPSHRLKKFRGLKRVKDGSDTRNSHSCENNGGCPYCENNRPHKHRKQPTLKDFEQEM